MSPMTLRNGHGWDCDNVAVTFDMSAALQLSGTLQIFLLADQLGTQILFLKRDGSGIAN